MNSENIALFLSKSNEFIQELADRLGTSNSLEKDKNNLQNKNRLECYSNPSTLVQKEILDILLKLCSKVSNPK
jgi:hypothetical protein